MNGIPLSISHGALELTAGSTVEEHRQTQKGALHRLELFRWSGERHARRMQVPFKFIVPSPCCALTECVHQISCRYPYAGKGCTFVFCLPLEHPQTQNVVHAKSKNRCNYTIKRRRSKNGTFFNVFQLIERQSLNL